MSISGIKSTVGCWPPLQRGNSASLLDYPLVMGTYVEGIKEEVVLSPAHALSLIASGEEHRHTIESSPCGENQGEEDVTLSQLNLIDLAGSESSKTETTGLRRKEGSYINKSLLTLGTLAILFEIAGNFGQKTSRSSCGRNTYDALIRFTKLQWANLHKSVVENSVGNICYAIKMGPVIVKLTDVKATHIPYRDSKLTRLLQSSLSGHGRVSVVLSIALLICTVTPASSNSEETHNTLKFAHRSKHVEIKASQNKIMDEKSLIKKYQREISTLKHELQQLKRGMMEKSYTTVSSQEDLVNLKLQLEAGQVKLQSRLEEEEQEKAALMGRIQRLTKLILVSSKNSITSSMPEKSSHRRRHSFGEDELAYLPDRRHECTIDDDVGSLDTEFSEGRYDAPNLDDAIKEYKKNRKRGMLGWFKLRKPDHVLGHSSFVDSESSASGSPASTSQLSQSKIPDMKDGRRKSVSRRGDDACSVDSFPERTQAGDLFSATVKGRRLPPCFLLNIAKVWMLVIDEGHWYKSGILSSERDSRHLPLHEPGRWVIFSGSSKFGHYNPSDLLIDLTHVCTYFSVHHSVDVCVTDNVPDLIPPKTEFHLYGIQRNKKTGTTITDQMDLLREQVKMLAGEVALCTSSLKRLSEQAASNPGDTNIQACKQCVVSNVSSENMHKLKDEISDKKLQMRLLEQRMIGSIEVTPNTSNSIEMSQTLSKLTTQLNEITFELEIKSADNRILQEQLQMKISENAEMHETILLLRQQLSSLSEKGSSHPKKMTENDVSMIKNCFSEGFKENAGWTEGFGSSEDNYVDGNTPSSVASLPGSFSQENFKGFNNEASLNSQVLTQAAEIENLKQEKVRLLEEKDGLEIHSQKLAEEASYAKELAAAAAVELRNLAEEVTKLSYQNAKLTSDLAKKESVIGRTNSLHRHTLCDGKHDEANSSRPDAYMRKSDDAVLIEQLQKELISRGDKEASLKAELSEKDQREAELQKQIEEAKLHEQDLENELANMWVLVAKMRKAGNASGDSLFDGVNGTDACQSSTTHNGFLSSNGNTVRMLKVGEFSLGPSGMDNLSTLEEVKLMLYVILVLDSDAIPQLLGSLYLIHVGLVFIEKNSIVENPIEYTGLHQGENLDGLDNAALEELQGLHVEAITKICHAKECKTCQQQSFCG
ncbi:hypothetical protein ACLOJK_014090 [Asimina triloba]